jgi:hypothetical protein
MAKPSNTFSISNIFSHSFSNKVKAEEIESQSEGSSSSSTSSSSREAAIATIKKRRRNDHTAEEELPSSVVPGSLKVNGVVRAKAFLQYSDLRLKVNFTIFIFVNFFKRRISLI